jgi:glycosyltransferase involved in cell wall biosynthesis
MPRLAWFSPMPPARTGVAAYSAAVVAGLLGEYDIDLFVDEPVAAFARSSIRGGTADPIARRIRSAHDFLWQHRRTPYALTVYQLGNSSAHDCLWPYLFRHPGLAVLHDAQLHHARAAALLRDRRPADYRAEFAAAHPDRPPDLAELAVAGFDNHLYYDLPMTRLVVRASRVTAVHAPLTARALAEESPASTIETIRIGHGEPVGAVRQAEAAAAVRSTYGIPPDGILFGLFGGLTPEKRVPQVLAAFAALLPYHPSARLLLAGAPAGHYDPAGDITRLGLSGAVHRTGYVETDEAFTTLVAACDVIIALRWPTAREVSGPWLRALAAARPTITLDLAHTADVPALDPRTWTVAHAGPGLEPPEPVTVSLDVLDEAHSLRLALRRLAADAGLRAQLGQAGARYWHQYHSVAGMLDDYRRVIPRAIATPAPAPMLPPHLTSDGTERLAALLGPFGIGAHVWSRI